ncbi:hypothetical protein HTZ77_12370 [Nonomuraea sp. SMC257]|uniref:Uncharacterized protein n=1 Tax=Nonomuraea montanisoli TaxID=2741721 RepID=A0A7Y6M221_9ACTN|nr:hypothetical protein [Nonomuraea montanisoli]NUW32223.1 hypothetical protein [Nonomuraea montanisoli]
MDLDEVADRLYGLPPSEFTAARAAEARAAKDAGDATLSREIGRLRKPTVSAWAVNRAVREHPDDLRELLEVGEELRRAWAAHDAEALAEVARRRGAVAERVGRLVTQDAGLSAAAAVEVDRTLDAAVVDEGAAAEVRRGRLVRPLEYSGFAPAPAESGAGTRRAEAAGAEAATGRADGAPGARSEAGTGGSRAARKAAAEERARRETEARAAREARRAQERMEAESAYLEWRETLAEAVQEHETRLEKVARLERKLTKARRKLRESEQRLEVARREERHARRRLEG